MIKLRLNGQDYINFISANVFNSVETLVGKFSFIATVDDDNLIPIKLNDYVEIIIDNIKISNGYVNDIRIDYSASDHVIQISGVGPLSDLVDSTIGNTRVYNGNYYIDQIARHVLNDLTLTNIRVINNAGTTNAFSSTDIEEAANNSTAFEFLSKLAKKRQVMLNSDQHGNLVLTRGHTGHSPTSLINKKGNDSNNILSASFKLNNVNRFSKYIIKSDLNLTNQESDINTESTMNQNGIVYDEDIRPSRVMEIVVDENMDSGSCIDRAKWEANIRNANSLVYTANVQGFSYDDLIWKHNKLVKIEDDFCKIVAEMLIKSVEYNYSVIDGSITTLTCVPKDSFTLKAKIDQYDSVKDDTGNSMMKTFIEGFDSLFYGDDGEEEDDEYETLSRFYGD